MTCFFLSFWFQLKCHFPRSPYPKLAFILVLNFPLCYSCFICKTCQNLWLFLLFVHFTWYFYPSSWLECKGIEGKKKLSQICHFGIKIILTWRQLKIKRHRKNP
jgi:hypothetical protein